MAERRMFSKKIIDSARFIKMPLETQSLYFHLGVRADDDGIVEAFSVMRLLGASEDSLKVLTAKGFVTILNDDLVTHISDWKEHNLIRSDRKVDSIYKDLLLRLIPDVELIEPKERADKKHNGRPLDVQVTSDGPHSIGKDSIGEVRKGKGSIVENACAYDKESDFSLSRDTHYDNLSKEYKEALQVFIESMGLSYPFDDFVNSLQAKASYKYKNFVKTYKTWAKNHIPKQAQQQRMDISKLPDGVSLQDMLNEAGEQWERERELEQKQIGVVR